MENQQQIVLDDYRSYLQDHSSIIGSDPEVFILAALVHGDLGLGCRRELRVNFNFKACSPLCSTETILQSNIAAAVPRTDRSPRARQPCSPHRQGARFTPPRSAPNGPKTRVGDSPAKVANALVSGHMSATVSPQETAWPISAGSGFESLMAHPRDWSSPSQPRRPISGVPRHHWHHAGTEVRAVVEVELCPSRSLTTFICIPTVRARSRVCRPRPAPYCRYGVRRRACRPDPGSRPRGAGDEREADVRRARLPRAREFGG